jgi:hypothetical protein
MRDHHHRIAAASAFPLGDGTADRGMHSQDVEKIPGNAYPGDLLRIPPAGDIQGFGDECRHRLEGAIPGFHLLKTRVGERPLPGIEPGALRGQKHQPACLGVRQRL